MWSYGWLSLLPLSVQENAILQSSFQKVNTPVILVINKIDTIKVQEEILTFIAAYKDVCDFAEIVPLSALKDKIQMCF